MRGSHVFRPQGRIACHWLCAGLAFAIVISGCTNTRPVVVDAPAVPTALVTLAPMTPAPSAEATSSRPVSEASLEPLPDVSPARTDVLDVAGSSGVVGLVTCGTQFAFDVSRLGGPPGAEGQAGPEFDALRTFLRDDRQLLGPDPGPMPVVREVARYDGRVAFLIDRIDPGPWSDDGGPYLYVYFNRVDGTWQWAGSGDCQPRAWGPSGYVGAQWTLDPAFPAPNPSTRVLHILVSEPECSGGGSASGRIGPAYVVVDRYEVHIEIVVKHRSDAEACEPTRPTPATVELQAPLGDRILHDTNQHLGAGTGG